MIEVTKVFTGDYDTAITIWFNSKNLEFSPVSHISLRDWLRGLPCTGCTKTQLEYTDGPKNV